MADAVIEAEFRVRKLLVKSNPRFCNHSRRESDMLLTETSLKVKTKAHSSFEPTSVDYDQRLCSFREWDRTFSLTLLHSRERLAPALGDHQKGRLKGSIPTSATLAKRRGGVQSPRRWRAARPRRSGFHV
ncbi:MAG TPA: hypothetical protein VLQ80_33525 [Candidatus Saccharimonadia bacterium]|nr:hypothetical protein [Candidatus Saccharimonadia bacterium]